MNELMTFNNVRCFINKNGIAELNLEDVARGLGFTENAKSGNETIRWRTLRGYLESFGIATSCDSETIVSVPEFIPENIFYRLAMKAKNETAEKFQIIVCDEILPSIRKTGSYSTNQPMQIEMKEIRETLDEVKQYYRLPHSAKINFNKRIKSKLGEEQTKVEIEDVKEYVFTVLGIDTWEDLPLDKRIDVIDLIDRRCSIIVKTRKNLFNWDKM